MKSSEEWIRQSEYDYDTARTLFNNRRYVYAVFVCHLAVEKALEGAWQVRHDDWRVLENLFPEKTSSRF